MKYWDVRQRTGVCIRDHPDWNPSVIDASALDFCLLMSAELLFLQHISDHNILQLEKLFIPLHCVRSPGFDLQHCLTKVKNMCMHTYCMGSQKWASQKKLFNFNSHFEPEWLLLLTQEDCLEFVRPALMI